MDGVSYDDAGLTYFKIDLALSLLSGIILGAVGLTIMIDTRIQAHPNKLIAYTCIFNSYNFFNFAMRYITCGYQLNTFLDEVFGMTVIEPY